MIASLQGDKPNEFQVPSCTTYFVVHLFFFFLAMDSETSCTVNRYLWRPALLWASVGVPHARNELWRMATCCAVRHYTYVEDYYNFARCNSSGCTVSFSLFSDSCVKPLVYVRYVCEARGRCSIVSEPNGITKCTSF